MPRCFNFNQLLENESYCPICQLSKHTVFRPTHNFVSRGSYCFHILTFWSSVVQRGWLLVTSLTYRYPSFYSPCCAKSVTICSFAFSFQPCVDFPICCWAHSCSLCPLLVGTCFPNSFTIVLVGFEQGTGLHVRIHLSCLNRSSTLYSC